MTKNEFDSLVIGKRYEVRYQFLGREVGQKCLRSAFRPDKVILSSPCGKHYRYVSYKSVDLIK